MTTPLFSPDSFFPPTEPILTVGLCENSSFGLIPEGVFHISASEESIVYTPADTQASMLVKGLTIGKQFHWQQNLDLRYRGVFIVRRDSLGSCLLNLIRAEDYLKSVISSEMSPHTPIEYLKAHAIISRSWVMRIKRGMRHQHANAQPSARRYISFTQNDLHTTFDICADDHCQRYQGIDSINQEATQAIEQTRGMVLTDTEGEIADTRFSKCCGGHTELFSSAWHNTDPYYLTAHPDPYCDPAKLSQAEQAALAQCLKGYDAKTDYYTWQIDVPHALIRENLSTIYGVNIGDNLRIHAIKRGSSGRIIELEVTGERDSIIVGKELAIRRLLSATHLPSSLFEITPKEDGFLLQGKGWGHGVGLCQIGAAVMALRGASCADIISFYYPGTQIAKIYE